MNATLMRRCLLATLLTVGAAPTAAQVLPDRPIRLADGQVAITGEVVGTIGERDDQAFFNYTDYEHNALRLFRLALTGRWQPSDRLALLGEIRSEDLEDVTAYGLYARVRPWKRYRFDIQAGRIPPVFGSFGRRTYDYDNPVIGYPLAYQYLLSLRPDAVPANANDLLLMRARGWLTQYPVGARGPEAGVPIASAYRWDTGVEAHLETDRFDAGVAVTSGTLSNPRVDDDNGGRQVSGRVAWRPVLGLAIGVSGARGEWLDGSLKRHLPEALRDRSYPQTAFGFDAEYSRDHWIVRSEVVESRWTLPAVEAPFITNPLRATSGYVEGQYRISPRFFVAGRADRLTFSTVQGTVFGGVPTPWEAPVDRLELGGGVYLQRNVVVRAVVQGNWRDGGRVRHEIFPSLQIAYWF